VKVRRVVTIGWADVSRAVAVGALVSLGAVGSATAQSLPEVHANAGLPSPRPTAPLADWVNAKGRVTVTLTAPGAILRGWSYTGTNPKAPTIVFFGGSGETIDRDNANLRALAALGPSVVAYDYRGYGFSVGLSDVARMQEDALRIVNATAQTAGVRGVVVYGYSFGTAMAASAASQTSVAGVILAAPFASAQEELAPASEADGVPPQIATQLTSAPDAVAAFANVDFVGRIQAPLLIVHGTADAVVPIAQGREVLAASTSQQKDLVELPGLGHDIVGAPGTRAAIASFIAALHP
jgi:pimeloyl-ACP methyl ester carboxylesterase